MFHNQREVARSAKSPALPHHKFFQTKEGCRKKSKSVYSRTMITRKKTRQIKVGNVPVGNGAPIAVQSMTNTDTRDVDATVAQI